MDVLQLSINMLPANDSALLSLPNIQNVYLI